MPVATAVQKQQEQWQRHGSSSSRSSRAQQYKRGGEAAGMVAEVVGRLVMVGW